MADEPRDEPLTERPKYDQKFFLALAAKGGDAWNAWRRDPANKDVRVTFVGVDFSQAPRDRIDFSGFQFGNEADFSFCNWRGEIWKGRPEAFGQGRAMFIGAGFGDGASFRGVTFGDRPDFYGAAFGGGATFAGAAFGKFAIFAETHFKGFVEFEGLSIEQWTRDLETTAKEMGDEGRTALKSQHGDLWKRLGIGPDRLSSIFFTNARFDSSADFSSRLFERHADFTNACFCRLPNFDGVTNPAQIDFTGAHIGFVPPGKRAWIEDSNVPLRLRALRKIAEETKNHDLERDLYIEERKAERGVYWHQRWEALKREGWRNWPRNAARLITHLLWIGVMGVYWALADYGRSFVRPFVWLIISGFVFYWGYGKVLAHLVPKASPIADRYERALGMLALGNAVPFIGPLTIDTKIKEFLFCAGEVADKCTPIPPEGFQLLVIVQNLFSITCVFFIGLALRNYFRIK